MVPPFQICIHTCPHNNDYMSIHNRRKEANACPIMHKNGSTYSNHIRSQKAHSQCTNQCRGFQWLGLPKGNGTTPQYKYRNPTHEEWLTWGVVLYQSLSARQQADWPQYYLQMVTDPGNPTPPSPTPATNIWTTTPPATLPPPTEQQTPQPLAESTPQPLATSTPQRFTSAPCLSPRSPSLIVSSPPLPFPAFPSVTRNSPVVEETETGPLLPWYPKSTLEREKKNGFSAIFIEDISHNCRDVDYRDDFEWTCGYVPDDFAAAVNLRAPGNIAPASHGEKGNYWMRDFLFYAVAMIKRGWQVDMMPWSVFFRAVRHRNGSAWAALLQQDMVVGGADLSGDYMNPIKGFEFTSARRFLNYVEGVSELSQTVHVWPHPWDLLQGGRKILQLCNSSQVASEIPAPFGPLPYPITVLIKSPDDLQERCMKNIVVKREYLECGETVIFGTDPDFVTKVAKGMQATDKNWSLLNPEFKPMWFAQPFLPTMKEKNEVRIFFVGGIPMLGVVTRMTNSQMVANPFMGALPLANILPGSYQEVKSPRNFQEERYYNVYDANTPYDLLEKGEKELYAFATSMLKGLIRKEEEIYGGNPSSPTWSGLLFFARLDIGILQAKETQKFVFWLNKVERGHNTGLFTNTTGRMGLRLPVSLVDCWEKWIVQKRLDKELIDKEVRCVKELIDDEIECV